MDRNEINWNEPYLVRWMNTTTRKGTAQTYRSAYRAYAEFTGLTAKQMIDEALEDSKRDPRERTDILKTRLLAFYDYLVKDFVVHKKGKGGNEPIRKGLHGGSAQMFVNCVRSFYATFELTVKLKGRQRLPRVKTHNKRMQLTTMNVKQLLDHARNPRDRAMILTMFQGGLDVATLCSMKYGDIAEGLDNNDEPLKVELQRPKTGVDFYTFLGRDAIEAVRAYLNDARARGIEFKATTPLFLEQVKGKHGEPLPLDTNIPQKVLREVANRCGLVDGENNGLDQNPCSPHALRESFGSIMINTGVPDTIVDFWLGHEIGTMGEAYKRGRFNEVKALYKEKERLISISVNESQAVEDIRKEFSDGIANLVLENKALKDRLVKVEEDLKWAIDEIENLETDGKGYEKEA